MKQRNPNGVGSYKLRKDGRYQWTQMIDGKIRTIYGNSPKELQEKVRKVSELPITSTKLKVEEWFDKYLEAYVKPLKKAATYNRDESIYRVHIKPEIGHRLLSSVKSYDIQTVIASMNKKGLSTSTMKEARGIMRRGFEKAYKEKLIPENPVIDIEIPKKQKKEIRVLSAEELHKLFSVLENSRWIWAVKLSLVTGLRRGELLALKWSDVDFVNKRLTIDESNSSAGVGDTKSAKIHYVPLSDKAIEYLHGQKNQLQKEFNPVLYNDDLKKTGLIFPSLKGQMVKPNSYYHIISRAAEKAGFKAHPHCLRHTFVYLTRHTMDLKELQYTLGHDESTTTLDIYGDIIGDTTVETAAKIDSVFDKFDEEIGRIEDAKNNKGKIIPFRRVK